jgi:hypothetical protein
MHTSGDEFSGIERAGAEQADSGFGQAGVPTELIREVATRLKTLAKALPYDEYAAIVHRVAWLRWRCVHAPVSGAPDEANHPDVGARDVPNDVATDAASGQLWQQVAAYSQFTEMQARTRSLLERAARARVDAAESVLAVASDRTRRRQETEARASLRRAMGEFVAPLKAHGESLDDVLRRTGHLLDLMRAVGAAADDQGELEADVMRLAAEEYCAAA